MDYSKYTDPSRLLSVDFEVFGLVHGVDFRRYTLQAADKFCVRGCVKKTRTGSVVGTLQGQKNDVASMKKWLYTIGSPTCVIQGTEFRNEREVINHEYNQFTISPSDW